MCLVFWTSVDGFRGGDGAGPAGGAGGAAGAVPGLHGGELPGPARVLSPTWTQDYF